MSIKPSIFYRGFFIIKRKEMKNMKRNKNLKKANTPFVKLRNLIWGL